MTKSKTLFCILCAAASLAIASLIWGCGDDSSDDDTITYNELGGFELPTLPPIIINMPTAVPTATPTPKHKCKKDKK